MQVEYGHGQDILYSERQVEVYVKACGYMD